MGCAWRPVSRAGGDPSSDARTGTPLLGELGLVSLGRRRLRGGLRAAFQYLKEACRKDGDRLFRRACCVRTRDNGFKLEEGGFRLEIRKKFFTMTVKPLPRLSREVVDAPSLETFQARLDGALSTLIQLKMSLLTAPQTGWPGEVPSHPNHSVMIL